MPKGIVSRIISKLSASTRDPFEDAAQRLRTAKPGEAVELPEGVNFEPLSSCDQNSDAVGKQSNADDIENDAESFRSARATFYNSLKAADTLVDHHRSERVVHELSNTEEQHADCADESSAVSDGDGRNSEHGAGGNDSLVPGIENLEVRKSAHLSPRHARVAEQVTPPSSHKASIRLTFSDTGDFVAESRAVALLEDCGFSVGRKQAHAPRGILFGLYDIQKWRNLSVSDREALHGVMTAGGRGGPVVVEIFESAPEIGVAAVRKWEALL